MQNNQADVKQYVDLDAALARLGGNRSIYRRMLEMTLQSDEFEKLGQALAQNDYERAQEVSHAIKGLTGNLSLPKLYATSTALNEQLKVGAPDAGTVKEYEAAYTETIEAIKTVSAQLGAQK